MKTISVEEIRKAADCVEGYEYEKTPEGKKLGAKVYVSQSLGAIARVPEGKKAPKEIDITPEGAEDSPSSPRDRGGSKR